MGALDKVKKAAKKAAGQAKDKVSNDPLGTLLYGVGGGGLGLVNDALGRPTQRIGGKVLGGPFAEDPPKLAYVPKPAGYASSTLLDDSFKLPTNLQIKSNQDALSQMRGIALGDQLSPWASTSLGQMNSLKDRLSGQVAQQNQSQARDAQNAMAATSGLSGVSTALLNDQAKSENILDQQRLRREQKQAASNIKTQDSRMRQSLLEGLPGAELGAAGIEQDNIMSRLTEKRRTDGLDKKRFRAEMGNFASEQTAEGIRNSKSNGILGGLLG